MRFRTLLPIAAIAALTSTMPAHAYLDPGTGTLIVQSLIGGIAAATTMAGVYFAKVKTVWNRLLGRKTEETQSGAQQ